MWDRGQEGILPCRVRTARATIRFSRSGRKSDYREASLNFLELVPVVEGMDPLVLVTTLPAGTLADAKGIARVYAQRWAIETGFETMHAWGQDRFMVRSFQAIDRLLWIVGLAHALMVLALRAGGLAAFRGQAKSLLKCQAVLGRRLTVASWPRPSGWISAGIAAPGPRPGSCDLLELEDDHLTARRRSASIIRRY